MKRAASSNLIAHSERFGTLFRAEEFNLFHHTNFGNSALNVSFFPLTGSRPQRRRRSASFQMAMRLEF